MNKIIISDGLSRVVASVLLAGSLITAAALTTQSAASATAPVQPAAARPAPATVAVVDIVKLISGLKEYSTRQDQAKARNDERQKQINELADQIDALKKAAEQTTDVAKRRELFLQSVELNAQTRARKEGLQQLIFIENGQTVREVYNKAMAAASKLAAQNGYDLVLMDDRAIELPENASEGEIQAIIQVKRMLHVDARLDVTAQLLQLMNTEWEAAAKP